MLVYDALFFLCPLAILVVFSLAETVGFGQVSYAFSGGNFRRLTGFALGFAFRDVLSNLLAGILLLLFRPFNIGDHISVTGLEGDVAKIDLSYTVIMQPNNLVLMPNANLFTNPILVRRTDQPQPPEPAPLR